MNRVSSRKILKNINLLNRKMPIHLNIDLCGLCNQKCSWCFFKGGIDENTDVMRDPELRKHILKTEIAAQIIKRHADCWEGEAITFVGGGEPLLHPNVKHILELAINSGHHIGIITNLSITFSDSMSVLLDECDWIRVSLDASKPETYKSIRGVNHFDRVIANMKRIKPKNLGISFLVHHSNYMDIKGIFDIAQEVMADYVQFKPVYQNDEELRKLPLTHTISNLIQDNKGDYKGEILNEYGSRLAMLTSKKKYPKYLCQIYKYRVHIGSDGNVYPCCIYKYSPEYCYGSLYKKSLFAILNNDLRKAIVNDKLNIADCPVCWDRDVQVDINELNYDDLLFV